MQPTAFQQYLHRAMERRRGLPGLDVERTDAYRLVDGEGDGCPGLFIDTFAGWWLVQTKEAPFPSELTGPELPRGCRSLWWKRLTNTGRAEPEWVAGERNPEVTVRENGLRYGIDFSSGYSQGIFLDQRENRMWLRNHCRPGSTVLNLFAYTCSFSVAAAAAGAATTSVDLSSRNLEWGQANFQLNGIDCGESSEHRFYKWDTLEFLSRAEKRGERYQFVINDPPTFSRNRKGKVFRVQDHYAPLVERCAGLLDDGGNLLTSTNYRGFDRGRIEEIVREAAARAGRKVKSLEFPGMPPDFTGDPYLLSCLAGF